MPPFDDIRAAGVSAWQTPGEALAAAEFRDDRPQRLLRVGTRIVVRGHIRYDVEHSWYVVDAVERLEGGWAGRWRLAP